MPVKQRQTITYLVAVLARSLVKSFDRNYPAWLEDKMHRACALVERELPIGINSTQLHQLHHFPANMMKFGPMTGWNMYVWEKMNHQVKSLAIGNNELETSIMKKYRVRF